MSKKTVSIIRESKQHYCIAVKGNQGKLLEQIKKNIAESSPIDDFFSSEQNRGRHENRFFQVYDNITGIDSQWVDIKRIVYVNRFGYRPDKGEFYNEEHYYILSKAIDDAELIAFGIRGHWGIENRLHYVKDVRQNEDNSGIKSGKAIENLSILKSIVINIFRKNGYDSIKKANIRFANKIDQMFEFLSQT